MAMKSGVNTSCRDCNDESGLTILDGQLLGTPGGVGGVPFHRTLLPQLAEVLVVVTFRSPVASPGREGK
jgi:hypothetical protein